VSGGKDFEKKTVVKGKIQRIGVFLIEFRKYHMIFFGIYDWAFLDFAAKFLYLLHAKLKKTHCFLSRMEDFEAINGINC
jgi:hypothetical protein